MLFFFLIGKKKVNLNGVTQSNLYYAYLAMAPIVSSQDK